MDIGELLSFKVSLVNSQIFNYDLLAFHFLAVHTRLN